MIGKNSVSLLPLCVPLRHFFTLHLGKNKRIMLDQRIIALYDEYTHKPLTRKEFLQRLTWLVGSTAAAMSVLPLLESAPVSSARVVSDGLFTDYITWPGVNGEMKAYLARPEAEKPYPTVLVIHENRGLNAHIEDVTRRAAQAGFLAVAPNALAPAGAQQSVAVAQQSPLAQQKPLPQWPLLQRASSAPQDWPSGRSAWQVWVCGLQNALASQSAWLLQVVGQAGGVWLTAPVQ